MTLPMPFPRAVVFLLALSLPLAACGTRPASGKGDWPVILPLAEVLGDKPAEAETAEAETRAVLARATALKRRAVLLRRASLSAAERLRLQRAADSADP